MIDHRRNLPGHGEISRFDFRQRVEAAARAGFKASASGTPNWSISWYIAACRK